jgi:hypothetical protein
MKAVDPSILVFGPVLSNKLDEWMPPFITACGDIIDGLSWHFYGGGARQGEAELLASTDRFDAQVAQVRRWWSDRALNPRGSARSVPLLISEYGASYDSNTSRNLTTLPAALWTADMLGRLALNRIDLAAYFALWGIQFHGVWDRRGNVRPVYHTFRLFHQFGGRIVAASSSQALLPAYASLRADGALTLMVINKDPQATYAATLDVQGFRISGAPQLLRQAKDQDGVPVQYSGPSERPVLLLPPYSTTLAVIPGEPAPPLALVGGAALAGAALLGGAAALIRRRRRARRATNAAR